MEYRKWFLAAVDEGVRAADAGRIATDEQVRAAFRKWGANTG